MQRLRLFWLALGLASMTCVSLSSPAAADADAEHTEEGTAPPATEHPAPLVAGRVAVAGVAKDHEIAARLDRILGATGWFQKPTVRVEQGVVSLAGKARRTFAAHPPWNHLRREEKTWGQTYRAAPRWLEHRSLSRQQYWRH